MLNGVVLPFAGGALALTTLVTRYASTRSEPLTEVGSLAEFVLPHVPGLMQQMPKLWLLLGAGTVLMVLGLIDDLRRLDWRLRLGVQTLVAAFIVWQGWQLSVFIDFAPLTAALSVIWIEVGRRAGIEVEGVGLPGHFLVYAAGQLVDPFHGGEAIGGDEAAALVADAMGGTPRLNPEWLRPVSPPDIVRRMLRNLEGIYRERESAADLEWIAACMDELDLLDRPTGGG